MTGEGTLLTEAAVIMFDHERYCNIPGDESQRLGAQKTWRSSELPSVGLQGKGWKEEVGREVEARR